MRGGPGGRGEEEIEELQSWGSRVYFPFFFLSPDHPKKSKSQTKSQLSKDTHWSLNTCPNE